MYTTLKTESFSATILVSKELNHFTNRIKKEVYHKSTFSNLHKSLWSDELKEFVKNF